jgi:hypothetical protein
MSQARLLDGAIVRKFVARVGSQAQGGVFVVKLVRVSCIEQVRHP